SPANWALYTPGLIPDNIASAKATNSKTLVLTFKRSYNPAYLTDDQLAYTLFPLPSTVWNVDSAGGTHLNWQVPANAKKIYDYLSKQGASLSTFASNPIWQTVDGAFKISSFNTTNSSFTLRANRAYTLTGKVRYSDLNVETFTSTSSQLDALRSGSLEIGTLDFSQLASAPSLRSQGDAVYGYPNIGTFGINLNFKDKTDDFGKVISQLYARQALAYLVDQPAYLKGILHGAASTAYGPLPTIPRTPFTPADAGTDPYPYSIAKAAKLLRAHGWKVVPGGQTTCVKPGAGAGECGAGIPAGTPFKFSLYSVPSDETAAIPLESEAFASAAREVGVQVSLVTKTFNFLISNFDDANPADAHYDNTWGATNWGEFGTTPYPTEQGVFNTTGAFNVGGFSDKKTDQMIEQAMYGNDPAVATKLADYLAKDVPMLFLPCADVVDVVSNKVGGTSDSWLAMSQDVWYPQYWYVKK
ncbi:MAG TPA: ABC transporter substrate-binding protein, partial [Solirubrobacteraceae bacterium]|nr:ABC transporter substrate-binding protein [Solirubrobacteraceae bacterium]